MNNINKISKNLYKKFRQYHKKAIIFDYELITLGSKTIEKIYYHEDKVIFGVYYKSERCIKDDSLSKAEIEKMIGFIKSLQM